MNLRFKKEYSDSNPRLSYELVSEELVIFWNEYWLRYEKYYNVKLIGFIPVYKMEEADENDRPAIEAFVKLSNL